MQMEARMTLQPALDGRGLVSAVIIEDQVQVQFGRHGGVDGFKKIAKLDRAMTPMELASRSPSRILHSTVPNQDRLIRWMIQQVISTKPSAR